MASRWEYASRRMRTAISDRNWGKPAPSLSRTISSVVTIVTRAA
ncbi:MAG: hypothetical protein ACUVXI_19440 [bacterium]